MRTKGLLPKALTAFVLASAIMLTACGGSSGQGANGTGQGTAQEQESSEGGLRKEEFEDVVLLDNDAVTVTLVSLYQKSVNMVQSDGSTKPMTDNCISMKYTDKTQYGTHIDFSAYLNGEKLRAAISGGSNGTEAGKTINTVYNIAKDTKPDHTELDSFEDLYDMDIAFEVMTKNEKGYLQDFSKDEINLGKAISGEAATAEEPSGPILETEHITLEGVYVDDSYQDSESDQLKMVYVFYTVNAKDENLRPASTSLTMTINGANSYTAAHYPGSSKYFKSYYYSEYLEDIYVGDSRKMLSTFKVPKGDLESGRTVTFSHTSISDASELRLSTDDIKKVDSTEALAKEMDPEGYAAELEGMEDADEETAARVRNALNGYYWTWYVNSISYKIEFYEPNSFDITSGIKGAYVSNSGTYSVKKGYVVLYYPSNDHTVEIPYSWKDDGDIDLDLVAAFDVKEG